MKAVSVSTFIFSVVFISACSTTCKSAQVENSVQPELIALKGSVTKVIVMNTTGETHINNVASAGTASLEVSKVKTSNICEFHHEQKGDTLYVGVRNRGFTGAGDCEINLKIIAPSATETEVTTTTGHVTFTLPKLSQPQIQFESKTGQLRSPIKSNAEGSPKITVRTQSGDLTIKTL